MRREGGFVVVDEYVALRREIASTLDERDREAEDAWTAIRKLPRGERRDRLVGVMADSRIVVEEARGLTSQALLEAARTSLSIVRDVLREARLGSVS